METTGTVLTYCIQCGKVIEDKPYEMSMDSSCASSNPVYFCSKECWEASDEFNTDNW
jgi:hypothetical protein